MYIKSKHENPKEIQHTQQKLAKPVKKPTLSPYEKLSNVQKEFYQILKEDKYASICAHKRLSVQLLNLNANPMQQEILFEEMLVRYAHNLANGCIDLKAMKKQIKKNRAKEIKSIFHHYDQKVNENRLLEQFKSNQYSMKEILQPYIPNHPEFLSMIKKLNDTTLDAQQRYVLRLNIERFKLLKSHKTQNFIQLNIPTYRFEFFEQGSKTVSFGTVVGDFKDQTPILSSTLKYFIVNPTWNIPDSIAKKTIIPRMLKDKNYLKKKHIEIHKTYDLNSVRYAQQDINWHKYLKKNVRYIPYKFIQLPYSSNGLGRVKFIFPNDYAVYMHDTIGSWRFKIDKQKIRAVSHGCVRLEHPLALIKHISTHYTKRSYASVRKDYDSHKLKTISLSKPLVVHLTYFSVSLDKENKLNFHKDLYGYDTMQKLNFSF
ncbi:MAG: L,D-transpeptidase family protein [Campylobacterota bacterium]|nr:L,D-transpeptidase family protein [Campylobacterota bacterium]